MKKTLTVNLGGSVFNIDEDAYRLLDKYLANLRIHFREEEGSDEIMNDFEARISELFSERVRLGYEVITIEHVEDVISRMGKPEDIFGEDASSEGNGEEEKKRVFREQVITGKKRLMRDPDNRVLGGVAAGLAAYMGWDVTAVRLAMIVLLLVPFVQWVVLLYILMWIVMPPARTAADRLIMRGESVSLESIGQTVTDGFEKVSRDVNDYISSEKPRSVLRKIADMIVAVVGFLLKFCAVLIGIILLPALLLVVFVLLVVVLALIAGGAGVLYSVFPAMGFMASVPNVYAAVTGCVALVLAIAIPVVTLLYAVCGQFFRLKPMSAAAKWTLLVLWLISTAGSIALLVKFGLPMPINF